MDNNDGHILNIRALMFLDVCITDFDATQHSSVILVCTQS